MCSKSTVSRKTYASMSAFFFFQDFSEIADLQAHSMAPDQCTVANAQTFGASEAYETVGKKYKILVHSSPDFKGFTKISVLC